MAVYTEVSDEELEAFVAQYDIARVVSCKGIAEGIENSNYLLQTETGNYILTLYEKRVEPADLPFFLGLMEHLAGRGVPCPTPLVGRDGEALRELAGRPAAIVSFLNGVWPRRPRPDQCGQLGDAVARLHIAGSDFALSRPNALSVAAWRPLFESCAGRADEVAPGLAEEIAAELEVLERDWPRDLPAGVIHADLFPDNVFFLTNQLSGLIDFYFACNDSFAYELAILLNAWCFEPDRQFNVTKARLMLAAYRRRRPFSEAELEALPLLTRGAALRFLLTRLYDWLNHVEGALVKPKDPLEYLQKLRFHQSVRGPAAYGLEWRPWAI
ncbi:MAG TPA: homoserine kinase [Alphaproteobacteria bacterium]|jgi:homoserine kinase type II|nr:homoserine kinase [Alphaproteobacteria bacterium]MDP6269447.1 homoserine kinase [Alphaproteobacteria bacterium]MDP7428557.1 homoserine kinase [Alphaproteobacteria bacterium]HJM49842.1 homoserine kinase [Alphaproteobacteria bacterium]